MARVTEGVVFLDPLVISVVPARTRDDALGALVGTLQPVREAAFAPLVQGCTELSKNGRSAVTVLDIALGSLTGAGSFSLLVGGVQATTAEVARTSLLGATPPPGGPAASLPQPPARPAVRAAPPAAPAAPAGARAPLPQQVAPPRLAAFGPAGRAALVAAGAAALLLACALAAADLRSIRRYLSEGAK